LELVKMVRAGMKRPASKGAGGAHKKRASPVAKKCALIAPTVRDAESLPQPVRKIISDRLAHVFGTYKEERHPFQVTVSTLVGNVLKTTQGDLQASINEARESKGASETEGNNLGAVSDAANAASEAAATALANSKTALAENHTAAKDAKAALHDLEAAVKTAESDTSSTTAKKEKLEALIKEFFTPVKEGTLDKGLNKSAAWVGKYLSKEFAADLEREFIVCVVRTFSKAASAWGTFDHIINTELDTALQRIVAALASELVGMEASKESRAADVQNAAAAVATAGENVKAADEAHSNAANAAKDARGAAKSAAAAAKQQEHHTEKAAATLEHAEHALTKFTEGPLAAYTEVEAHKRPPPPPEPEASPVDAAMEPAPAPAARAAPTILPSPGVLSWVAQASGLSRSPQLAPSPRAS